MKEMKFIAVSDLHGRISRYEKLFELIRDEQPDAVFIAGDLTQGFYRIHLGEDIEGFILKYLRDDLQKLKDEMQENYPAIFVIMGNDDPRLLEEAVQKLDADGLWNYVHNRRIEWKGYHISGYAYVPPTPFQMKDWEKFDISRFVDVGAIAPDGGFRTVEADPLELEWGTIKRDLEKLYADENLTYDICIFHSPPYKTQLDRAALDGKMIDYAPLDVHIGSIAIKEFIQKRQPLLTLHGHVHESTRITGNWQENINKTLMFNCANDGDELAVIRINTKDIGLAKRSLI